MDVKSPPTFIENYYSSWHDKSDKEIEYDINACVEKCTAASKLLKQIDIGVINSVLEIGCGYGRNVVEIIKHTNASFGLGCDISKNSIKYAKKFYENDTIKFLHNSSLDGNKAVSEISEIYNNLFDLLILFDVLEHVPKPKDLIQEISRITKYFFIILPLDDTILDNYFLPAKNKTYPSSYHPSGHLWEFNVNDVHKFVSSLGLATIAHDYHIWSIADEFPNHLIPKSFKGKLYFLFRKFINYTLRRIMPKKLFLRLIGRGYFVCVATWDSEFVLD